MNYGLIVAGGKGARFGGFKQFALLNGKPLLYYSLKAFEKCPEIKEVVLVLPKEKRILEKGKRLINKFGFKKIKQIIPGGKERSDSVFLGLKALPNTGYVAIHDGVRPFITPETISKGFKFLRKDRTVTYGIPIYETVKTVKKRRVIKTINRNSLYLIQTPQFFSIPLIKMAYEKARKNNYSGTDDAELVERVRPKPEILVLFGSKLNIKITTRKDLEIVRKIRYKI